MRQVIHFAVYDVLAVSKRRGAVAPVQIKLSLNGCDFGEEQGCERERWERFGAFDNVTHNVAQSSACLT